VKALRLGETLTGARWQIGRVGELLQPRPHVGKALRDTRHGLRLSLLQVIRVIERPQRTHQFTGLGLTRLRLRVVGFGLYHDREGGLNVGRERWRAPTGARGLGVIGLLGRARNVQLPLGGRDGGFPLFGPLQARAVLHDHPRAIRRVAPDGIDPRVCATVGSGRTFDHVPLPSVC
jgi:hypothetical protein